MVESLFESRFVVPGYTSFIIQGGEAVLHPQCGEILLAVQKQGFNYALLSNGLDSRRLVDFVEKFNIENVTLSLDGCPSTYMKVRGVDGYGSVIKSIEELKKTKTAVTIAYTINPWNCREDYIHVSEIAKRYGVALKTVIYGDANIFNTDFKGYVFYDTSDLMKNDLEQKFVLLYKKWLAGARIPCTSIFDNTFVMPNGDVRLCHCSKVILGNLSKDSFDSIWLSKKTKKILRQHQTCNKCYGHCHRMYDLSMLDKAKFLPIFILKKLFCGGDIGLIVNELRRKS